MNNPLRLRNGLPRTSAAIERREFFRYCAGIMLRVAAYLVASLGAGGILVLIGCGIWLAFVNAITVESTCPMPRPGERLIARYYTPSGTVSCRYATAGISRAEQVRSTPAQPLSK